MTDATETAPLSSFKASRRLPSTNIRVGCCGFSLPGGMRSYYRHFDLVEIQTTFYNIPHLETIDKWRSEAPVNFEFAPKAFQGITHPVTSRTWSRFRGKLPNADKELDRYGFFKPTDEVVDCWKTMIQICSKLRSEAILVQTPPNFGCSTQNTANMEKLFTTVDRRRIAVCWEPRGNWIDNLDKIRGICSKLDLVHVVDLMRRESLSSHEFSYIRLHGLNPREFDYRYRYSDEELLSLREKILGMENRSTRIYVLFNNTNMANDARRFREMLGQTT